MNNIDKKAIDTLRVLSVEQITKAKSGHPGIALGAAPIIHTLYSKIMNIYPNEPNWPNRDRFILAAGHGSSLLYSILHLAGYGLSIEDLKSFRQLGSITPGHPEVTDTAGVDATSGPLGQGIAAGVGISIAEEFLRNKYNKDEFKLIDHYTYVLCGDGDLQEGVTQEAMSLAGHLELSRLIVLYDSNDIQLDGKVSEVNTEDVKAKYTAMGWDYFYVGDAEDILELEKVITEAKETKKPAIIEIKSIIGRGTSVANSSKAHGSPLSVDEVMKLRAALGGVSFSASDEVYDFYKTSIIKRGEAAYRKWQEARNNYTYKYASLGEEFKKVIDRTLEVDFNNLISFPEDFSKATRVSSGMVLDALSAAHPTIIGGSADLASSTRAKGADGDFSKANRLGRNLNFGVREHAMTAITNGLALHGGVRPFCSGFFVFSDYMKPAMRLASIMELPVTYVFTHDSVAVGEDGPTHQPIEQLTMLRSIPNFNLIRPADANEVLEAWKIAYSSKKTPTALVLSRQDLPSVSNKDLAKGLENGAYIIKKEAKKLHGIIVASGSEVSLALKVSDVLAEEGYGIRVISMPSMYLFDKQDKKYKEELFPKKAKKILAIEASEAAHYYKYVGSEGAVFNINKFGASAPGDLVMSEYGFNLENIKSEMVKVIKGK